MSFSLYVLKSHESFTYVSPDVFSVLHKTVIINVLQDIVRVSFSAPRHENMPYSALWGIFLFYNKPEIGAKTSNFTPILHLLICLTIGR